MTRLSAAWSGSVGLPSGPTAGSANHGLCPRPTGGAGIRLRWIATATPDAATVALSNATAVAALNDRRQVNADGVVATAFQVMPREATGFPPTGAMRKARTSRPPVYTS